MEIYSKLGLKPQNNIETKILNNSVKKNFKISNIGNFNSYLTNFSIRINNKTFNNKKQIIKIIKKKKNVHINGGLYKCLIKSNGKKYNIDIFIKESPIINPLSHINYNIDTKTDYSYKNYIINNLLFNKDSNSNIELFINYLVSKLVELNISPNFAYFFGFNLVTMDKFTIEYENNTLNLDSIKKYKLYKKKNTSYLEIYDIPTILIYNEKLTDDLNNYIRYKNTILEHEWSNYILQVIFGLTLIQKYFNICHNDLHCSNIMYKYTDEKYIYYCYKNKYYRIFTYNKILKIIDWGRSTYNFNDFIGKNNVFSLEGDVFGQYIYNKINNLGKKNIQINPNIDLSILGNDLLSYINFPKKGKLYNFILSWFNYNKNNKDMFNVYCKIAKNANNSIPKNQIEHDIFKKFLISEDKIPNNSIIYYL